MITKIPVDLLKYIFTFLNPFTITITPNSNPYFLSIKRKLLNPIPLVCNHFYVNYTNIVCPFCYEGTYTITKQYKKGMFQFHKNCNTCGHRKRKRKQSPTDSSHPSPRKIRRE